MERIIFLSAMLLFVLTGCENDSLNIQENNEGVNTKEALQAQSNKFGLINMDFEAQEVANNKVDGWKFMQHAGPKSYEFMLDKEVFHGGGQSLQMKNIGKEPYGLAEQKIPAIEFQGKKVALSAWIKTQEANGVGAGLSMRAMRDSAIAAYNFMSNELVRGTQDWKKYTISLEIPENTTDLEIGFMLQGGGTAWVDDFELEVLSN